MKLEVFDNMVVFHLKDGRMVTISDFWSHNQHGIAVSLPNGTYKSGEHYLVVFDNDLGFPNVGNKDMQLKRVDDSFDVV